VGLFPEQAVQWDWAGGLIRAARRPVKVLNLFGYTGLASLAAAEAGASVTHVDASPKSIEWARENQRIAGLNDRPIRWLVDDALKFARREARRESRYDALIIDPPKFGRGPKGEVWKLGESLPALLEACRAVMTEQPLFIILTVYAIRASAVGLQYLLEPAVEGLGGRIEVGEMGLAERERGRVLSTAIFARWAA
jgi:23S rRNA (cytosine1962-C5)-methyltransferase